MLSYKIRLNGSRRRQGQGYKGFFEKEGMYCGG